MACATRNCVYSRVFDPMLCYCDVADQATCMAGGAAGPCKPEFEAAAGTTDPTAILAALTSTASPVGVAVRMARCGWGMCDGWICAIDRDVSDPRTTLRPTAPPVGPGTPPTCTLAPAWIQDATPVRSDTQLWSAGVDDTWLADTSGARHWDGVSWTNVTPPWGYNAVPSWGRSPDNLWFAASRLWRWDGKAWTTMLMQNVTRGWMAAPNDVWVFANGRLLEWNGTAWRDRSPLSTERASSYAVWPVSADDVWVFSERSSRGGAHAVWHWNGSTWSVPTVDASLLALRVADLWGSAANDIWLIGDPTSHDPAGFLTLGGPTQIWHYDGVTWRRSFVVPGDAVSDKARLVGKAANDVWAFPALLHFDGTAWSTVDSGAIKIKQVAAESAERVWVLGEGGGYKTASTPAVFHYRRPCQADPAGGAPGSPITAGGLTWTAEPRQGLDGTIALWAFGPDDVWRSSGREVARWNGQRWSTLLTSDGCATQYTFGDIWGSSGRDVWIGGLSLQHWDGARVEDRTPPKPAGVVKITIDAIHGFGTDDVWALATSICTPPSLACPPTPSPPASRNTLYHWDGRGWTAHAVPAVAVPGDPDPSYLLIRDLWGAAPNDVWGVGWVERVTNMAGKLVIAAFVHWDGRAWTLASNLSDTALYGYGVSYVWGSGPSDVWAAGSGIGGGRVWRFDGTTWTRMLQDESSYPNGVWGSGPTDVWLSGGTLQHYDGATFSAVDVNAADYRTGVSASRDDVWVVGWYASRDFVLLHGKR